MSGEVIARSRVGARGRISWVDEERRSCFIASEDGRDLFVDLSELTEASFVVVGAAVEFQLGTGRYGRPAATRVRHHAE